MHLIVKYKNRKLYSKKLKKYVNLTEIPSIIKNEDIKVIQQVDGKDITDTILASILSKLALGKDHIINLIKNSCAN